MRVLVYLGQLILILGLGAAAVVIWVVVLAGGDPGTLARLDEVDWDRVLAGEAAEGGAGEAPGGLTLSADGRRAEVAFADGRRVALSVPAGMTVLPALSHLDGETAALRLSPEEGAAFYVLLSMTEGLGTATLTEKMAVYDEIAGQMRDQGGIGPSGNRVAVADIRHDARGLFYCMTRWGREELTGARLRRGVLVIVVLRRGCGTATPADIARLDSIVTAVTPDRWR